jgi:hypothetical protein
MKGLVFGGCSFTWGQGLYFYSDLPRLKEPDQPYAYKGELVQESHILYKETIRYPRLVANYFNTFETFKLGNGGSEDETFEFLDVLFHKKDNPTYGSHLTEERMDYSEVEYIIVQLSQLWRNKYYFEYNGYRQSSMLWPNNHDIGHNQENLFNWLIENNLTFDEWVVLHKEVQYLRLKKEFEFYESKGIKCRVLAWEDDLLNYIFNDEFLKERFIPLDYNGNTFNTIRELHNTHKDMAIDGDYKYFGKKTPSDHHPSKKCHELIAENIINKINKELLK